MGNLHLTSLLSGGVWTAVVILMVVVCLVALGLVVARGSFLNGEAGGLHTRREAEQAYKEFHGALEEVRHQRAALDAYSNAYFNTFHSAGWDELRLLMDDLDLVESSLLVLMERGKWREARDISRFLTGDLSPGAAQELLNEFDGLEQVADWRQRSRGILLRVVQASMDSARKIASVGVNRSRSAKPTLITLAEIRSLLTQAQTR